MTLPRSAEEYERYIGERLNFFERLMDRATGTDERIDLTNRLLMELLKVSAEEKEAFPFPPALSRALIDHLTKDKPEFYKFIDIDLSTARTNEIYPEAGDFIWVDNQFARGEVTLRLNEEKFGKYDLRRQKYIKGPFYRFYITNVAGEGLIRLFISRGYQAASEPIETITRAELAARLGSIDTFDRRGDVIWLDEFGNGIGKWSIGGGTKEVSSVYSRNRAFSIKLTTDDEFLLTHKMPYPCLSRIGFEFSFSFSTYLAYIYIAIELFDGDYQYYGCTKYIFSDAGVPVFKCQYYDGDLNAFVDLTPLVVLAGDWKIFHTIKLVIDFETKKYVRLILDSTEFDLTNKPLEISEVAGAAYLMLDVDAKHYEDDLVIYGDDPIVTQNEP